MRKYKLTICTIVTTPVYTANNRKVDYQVSTGQEAAQLFTAAVTTVMAEHGEALRNRQIKIDVQIDDTFGFSVTGLTVIDQMAQLKGVVDEQNPWLVAAFDAMIDRGPNARFNIRASAIGTHCLEYAYVAVQVPNIITELYRVKSLIEGRETESIQPESVNKMLKTVRNQKLMNWFANFRSEVARSILIKRDIAEIPKILQDLEMLYPEIEVIQ